VCKSGPPTARQLPGRIAGGCFDANWTYDGSVEGRARVLALLALVAAIVVACAPIASPRTANTLPEGKLGGGFRMAGWAFGSGRLAGSEGEQRAYTGGADVPQETNGFSYVMSGLPWEADLRYGLARWAEVGASVGFQRLGGELRLAVLDEDVGHPLSVAASAGGYYSAVGDGPLWRLGVDSSVRFDRVAPLLGLYLSRGASYHSALLDVPGDEDCPKEGWPGSRCGIYLAATSWETRLSAPLGLAIDTGEYETMAVVLGAVPHLVIHASEPRSVTGERPEVVHHDMGLHIVAGVELPGW
jgi:hypothetical protein